jgi:hypothetical protein
MAGRPARPCPSIVDCSSRLDCPRVLPTAGRRVR